MPEKCPRCGSTEFEEHDCGPDTYEDDMVWTAWSCKKCGLWYSEWSEKWLVDCEVWIDEESADEFPTPL